MPTTFTRALRHCKQVFRPLVVWCLLVAVPIYGVSGTLVELLGANHVHRAVPTAAPAVAQAPHGHLHAHAHPNTHTHSALQRHHHDPDDDSVIAIDGGALQGSASDDGGSPGSTFHPLASTDAAAALPQPRLRFAWPAAAPAAATRWTADGPMRPPKA